MEDKTEHISVPKSDSHPAYEVTVPICTCGDSHEVLEMETKYKGIIMFTCSKCHKVIEGYIM